MHIYIYIYIYKINYTKKNEGELGEWQIITEDSKFIVNNIIMDHNGKLIFCWILLNTLPVVLDNMAHPDGYLYHERALSRRWVIKFRDWTFNHDSSLNNEKKIFLMIEYWARGESNESYKNKGWRVSNIPPAHIQGFMARSWV